MINLSFGNLFAYVSLFCCVSFFPLFNVDIQPYFIFCSLLFLFSVNKIKIPFEIYLILLACLASSVLLLIDITTFGFNLMSLQKWSKYIVLLVSTVTFYQYLRIYPLPIKQIKGFIYVATIVAIIQVIFDKRFFDFFLYRIATDEARGVTSVFPEPTYYGMYCLMLMVLLQQFKYQRKDLYILLIFNIVILAQSSQAILFLFVWGIVKSYFALDKKWKVILVSSGLLFTYFAELIFSRLNSLFDIHDYSFFHWPISMN